MFSVRDTSFAHAVNDRKKLDAALSDSMINFLEADVIIDPKGNGKPVMGHNPGSSEWDCTFEEWLLSSIQHKKGLKLDLKEYSCIDPVLSILEQHFPQPSPPITNSMEPTDADTGSSPSSTSSLHANILCVFDDANISQTTLLVSGGQEQLPFEITGGYIAESDISLHDAQNTLVDDCQRANGALTSTQSTAQENSLSEANGTTQTLADALHSTMSSPSNADKFAKTLKMPPEFYHKIGLLHQCLASDEDFFAASNSTNSTPLMINADILTCRSLLFQLKYLEQQIALIESQAPKTPPNNGTIADRVISSRPTASGAESYLHLGSARSHTDVQHSVNTPRVPGANSSPLLPHDVSPYTSSPGGRFTTRSRSNVYSAPRSQHHTHAASARNTPRNPSEARKIHISESPSPSQPQYLSPTAASLLKHRKAQITYNFSASPVSSRSPISPPQITARSGDSPASSTATPVSETVPYTEGPLPVSSKLYTSPVITPNPSRRRLSVVSSVSISTTDGSYSREITIHDPTKAVPPALKQQQQGAHTSPNRVSHDTRYHGSSDFRGESHDRHRRMSTVSVASVASAMSSVTRTPASALSPRLTGLPSAMKTPLFRLNEPRQHPLSTRSEGSVRISPTGSHTQATRDIANNANNARMKRNSVSSVRSGVSTASAASVRRSIGKNASASDQAQTNASLRKKIREIRRLEREGNLTPRKLDLESLLEEESMQQAHGKARSPIPSSWPSSIDQSACSLAPEQRMLSPTHGPYERISILDQYPSSSLDPIDESPLHSAYHTLAPSPMPSARGEAQIRAIAPSKSLLGSIPPTAAFPSVSTPSLEFGSPLNAQTGSLFEAPTYNAIPPLTVHSGCLFNPDRKAYTSPEAQIHAARGFLRQILSSRPDAILSIGWVTRGEGRDVFLDHATTAPSPPASPSAATGVSAMDSKLGLACVPPCFDFRGYTYGDVEDMVESLLGIVPNVTVVTKQDIETMESVIRDVFDPSAALFPMHDTDPSIHHRHSAYNPGQDSGSPLYYSVQLSDDASQEPTFEKRPTLEISSCLSSLSPVYSSTEANTFLGKLEKLRQLVNATASSNYVGVEGEDDPMSKWSPTNSQGPRITFPIRASFILHSLGPLLLLLLKVPNSTLTIWSHYGLSEPVEALTRCILPPHRTFYDIPPTFPPQPKNATTYIPPEEYMQVVDRYSFGVKVAEPAKLPSIYVQLQGTHDDRSRLLLLGQATSLPTALEPQFYRSNVVRIDLSCLPPEKKLLPKMLPGEVEVFYSDKTKANVDLEALNHDPSVSTELAKAIQTEYNGDATVSEAPATTVTTALPIIEESVPIDQRDPQEEIDKKQEEVQDPMHPTTMDHSFAEKYEEDEEEGENDAMSSNGPEETLLSEQLEDFDPFPDNTSDDRFEFQNPLFTKKLASPTKQSSEGTVNSPSALANIASRNKLSPIFQFRSVAANTPPNARTRHSAISTSKNNPQTRGKSNASVASSVGLPPNAQLDTIFSETLHSLKSSLELELQGLCRELREQVKQGLFQPVTALSTTSPVPLTPDTQAPHADGLPRPTDREFSTHAVDLVEDASEQDQDAPGQRQEPNTDTAVAAEDTDGVLSQPCEDISAPSTSQSPRPEESHRAASPSPEETTTSMLEPLPYEIALPLEYDPTARPSLIDNNALPPLPSKIPPPISSLKGKPFTLSNASLLSDIPESDLLVDSVNASPHHSDFDCFLPEETQQVEFTGEIHSARKIRSRRMTVGSKQMDQEPHETILLPNAPKPVCSFTIVKKMVFDEAPSSEGPLQAGTPMECMSEPLTMDPASVLPSIKDCDKQLKLDEPEPTSHVDTHVYPISKPLVDEYQNNPYDFMTSTAAVSSAGLAVTIGGILAVATKFFTEKR